MYFCKSEDIFDHPAGGMGLCQGLVCLFPDPRLRHLPLFLTTWWETCCVSHALNLDEKTLIGEAKTITDNLKNFFFLILKKSFLPDLHTHTHVHIYT